MIAKSSRYIKTLAGFKWTLKVFFASFQQIL